MSRIIYDFDKGVERGGIDAKKYDPSLCPGDVLPFWIAGTDSPGPVEVIKALGEHVEMNHYGYLCIDPAFEESIIRWYKVRHNVVLNSEYADFSPCVIPTIIWFAEEFSSVEDKILLQTPICPPFHDLVKNNGRQLVYGEMDLVNGRYEVNFEGLEKKLSDPKVKILFICNLQSPTGRCFTRKELVRMGEICIRSRMMIGMDEIRGDIIFDGYTLILFCGTSEKFTDRSVTLTNPVKTFNVAGFRTTAQLTHNKETYRRTMNQQTHKRGMGRDIFRNAALMACYSHRDDYVNQCVAYSNETKGQVVVHTNKNIPKIRAIEPEATFTIWMDCRGLGFQSQKGLEDFIFRGAKVLLNDRVTFGGREGKRFMRFNFMAPRAVVMERLKRIREAADRP